MNSDLLSMGSSAAGAVALLFLGAWENGRRTRKTEQRKDAAADRAALEAQANELVAVMLALKVAANTHDTVWAGRGARVRVLLRALMQGSVAYGVARGRGIDAGVLAATGEAAQVVHRWDQDSWIAAGDKLAAPLARLGAAVAPLLRRKDLGPATEALFAVVVEHYGDDDRVAAALKDFNEAVSSILEPPAPTHRRWSLRRRGGREELPAR